MATLHIVTRAQALESCLRVAGPDDAVLLIEQAIEAATTIHYRDLLLLLDPLEIVVQQNCTATDYPGFVDLVVRHQPIVTWR